MQVVMLCFDEKNPDIAKAVTKCCFAVKQSVHCRLYGSEKGPMRHFEEVWEENR